MARPPGQEDAWVTGVVVLSVSADADCIKVDIVGGDAAVVGSIEYHPDHRTFHDTLATLLYWKDHGTPLTYLCRRGVASLRDERALFAEAWGADPPGER